MHALLGLIQ